MRCTALGLCLAFSLQAATVHAEGVLEAPTVAEAPVINGRGDDGAWRAAPELRPSAAWSLRAVRHRDELFLLVRFADPLENREHKPLRWDARARMYRAARRYEDQLLLEWSTLPVNGPWNGRILAPKKTDLWHWKAMRTDPAARADDGFRFYSREALPDSVALLDADGSNLYLTARYDEGTPSYEAVVPPENDQGPLAGFHLRGPAGSRADVRARGRWQQGWWTVELSRRLDTGNRDDLAFHPGRGYGLVISRAAPLPSQAPRAPTGDDLVLVLSFR